MTTPTPQQVLSDDEIKAIGKVKLILAWLESPEVDFARAIESAVLAKLQAAPQADSPLWKAFKDMQAAQVKIDPEIAQATAKGFRTMFDEAPQAAHPEFTLEDPDLNMLVNLAADMAQGRANMDTGVLWLETLEKVRARLAPQAQPEQAAQGVGEEFMVSEVKHDCGIIHLVTINAEDVPNSVEVGQQVRLHPAPSPAVAVPDEVLETIRVKAEAGLCQYTTSGARAYLTEIAALATQQAQTAQQAGG